MSTNVTTAALTVTAGGSAHALGSFATARAAGTYPRCEAFTIVIMTTGTGNGSYILEMYQGASDTLIGKIPFDAQYVNTYYSLTLPVAIPADVQVRFRVRCSNASRTCVVTLQGHVDSPFFCKGAATFTALAADDSTSIGYVGVTAGNATFTGSAQTINAGTAEDYNFFVMYGRSSTTGGGANCLVRLLDDGADISGSAFAALTNNGGNVFHTCCWADVAAGSVMTIEGNSASATYNSFRAHAIAVALSASPGSLVSTEADMQYDSRPLSGAGEILSVRLNGTDGLPITGKTYADVVCALSVDGAAPSAQTLVDMTLGVYTSLGFKQQSSTLAPGLYAFCPATLPSSGKRAVFTFSGTGIRQAELIVDLVASDPRAASLTKEQIATEALVTFLMGRGHKVEEVGTDIILYDTDGVTVLAQPPRTRSGASLNSITALGPD